MQYEEVDVADEPQPRVIETGDSVKVKQVLDDATTETLVSENVFEPNYMWENIKLLLMFLSCVFAMVAQFYPIPFPKSRPLLGVCCAMYFVLSSVLQFMITYIDKDIILISKPEKGTGKTILVRTNFPRFQEYFTLVFQYQEKDTTGGKVKRNHTHCCAPVTRPVLNSPHPHRPTPQPQGAAGDRDDGQDVRGEVLHRQGRVRRGDVRQGPLDAHGTVPAEKIHGVHVRPQDGLSEVARRLFLLFFPFFYYN